MNDTFKNIALRLFAFVLYTYILFIPFYTEELYASESLESTLIQKVSKSYTKKFCNSIGFGLSQESAMNFSLQENNQVFNKRKDFKSLNKELLAEEIAIAVVEKCGYPINLSGEKGILEFKNYYLSKDQDSSEKK